MPYSKNSVTSCDFNQQLWRCERGSLCFAHLCRTAYLEFVNLGLVGGGCRRGRRGHLGRSETPLVGIVRCKESPTSFM